MINIDNILITLLFKDKKEIIKKINFKKINYDNIIKLASYHLMIPTLYFRLKENNLLQLLDNDFKDYIGYIYELNKIRNNNFLDELKDLSKLFKENEIDHVFLKGSAYIISGRFNDIGERMIGDIDVLVSKSDYDKAIRLSKKYGYKNSSISFFKSRHYPRMINPKKLFALEIHNKLLTKKNKLLDPERFLKRKEIHSNIYVPNLKDRILHTIYNEQINDYGNLKAYISYRSLYDIASYKAEINGLIKNKNSKYLKNYLLMSNHLDITNSNIKLNFVNIIYLFRFQAKKKYKAYYMIDDFICKIIYATPIRVNKLFKLITNSEYRSFLFEKIKKN